jgi:hypothetical protein
VVKAFKQLLQDSNASVFVVNASSKGKQLAAEDLQKILSATADGSAAAAKVGSGYSALSPVSALAGVKLETGDASKEKDYVNHVKTTFGNVTF